MVDNTFRNSVDRIFETKIWIRNISKNEINLNTKSFFHGKNDAGFTDWRSDVFIKSKDSVETVINWKTKIFNGNRPILRSDQTVWITFGPPIFDQGYVNLKVKRKGFKTLLFSNI